LKEGFMNKHNISGLLAIVCFLALTSCTIEPSSSSDSEKGSSTGELSTAESSSSISDSSFLSTSIDEDDLGDTITYAEAISILDTSKDIEAANASIEKKTSTATKASVETTETMTKTICSDSSSQAEGTVTSIDKQNSTQVSDTIKERTKVIADRIKDNNGSINSFNMLYYVKNYDKNLLGSSDYSDQSNRIYVLKKSEAESSGLPSSSFILNTDVPAALTYQGAASLSSFISTNVINNAYAQQSKATTMKVESLNNQYRISSSFTYEIDGDLNDTLTYTFSISFVIKKIDYSLLSYETKYSCSDASKTDKDDVYFSESKEAMEITYGEKSEATKEAINPKDYFLKVIKEIEFLNSSRQPEDSSKFPIDSTFLFAKPKVYEPSTALDINENTLGRISSSNSNVIKLTDDGYFELVNDGTTELTFSYYGTNGDGVLEENTITKNVTVVLPKPTEIKILSNANITKNTLRKGKTYNVSLFVGPSSRADQRVKVESDNTTVLKATTGENNQDMILSPLTEGQATVTITSVADPTIKTTVTYTVAGASLTTEETLKAVQNKAFKYTNTIYEYSIKLAFSNDGTGTITQTSNNKDYPFSFSFTTSGNKVILSDISDDTLSNYENGVVSDDGKTITFEVNYSDREFVLQA